MFDPKLLSLFLETVFLEDVGDGDHTSLSVIPAHTTGKARLLVKEPGILAGVEVASLVFQHFDNALSLEILLQDGTPVQPGDVAFIVSGRVLSILQCERIVLNIMQRMSGIATRTRQYVDRLQGLSTRVLDTRKTTPGMRIFDKAAVKIGGGENHRMGLFDMILIKDNHIDYAGGIPEAILAARNYLQSVGKSLKIEIEARNLEELEQILTVGGIDRIMLDNFTPETTREAVRLIAGRYETESSGGITLNNLRDYAACGVDYISVGALTHQIKSLDLSLKAIDF